MLPLLRTGLFLSALRFRPHVYRSGGWPDLYASEEPHRAYAAFLRRHYSSHEIRSALERADRYIEHKVQGELPFSVILNSDKRYPPLLKSIFDPPPVLFWKGPYFADASYIAVVGTRYPDRITIQAVDRFADCLADAGSLAGLRQACIEESLPGLFPSVDRHDDTAHAPLITVSGFAFGVDERIHRACLYRKIPTLAILGSGIETITPVSNRYLIDEAEGMQAPLSFASEFFPEDPPRRFAYPRRNRIIAGMCPLCIVFQAGPRSGALITARFALEEGRDVAAFDHVDLLGTGKNEGARHLLAEGAGRLRLLAA